jgi:radical SAM protein with 4Fe4S-binding SPASM domain
MGTAAGAPPPHPASPRPGGAFRPPLAVGDGRGVVFVSHIGEVTPSGFLPFVAGNVRDEPLTEIYRAAPILKSLRDADLLTGRCGRCKYRVICGGSRSRAYAISGDPLGEDPACPYEPDGSPEVLTAAATP